MTSLAIIKSDLNFVIMRTLCVVILAVLIATVTSRVPRYNEMPDAARREYLNHLEAENHRHVHIAVPIAINPHMIRSPWPHGFFSKKLCP
ncbi:hypothetical protein ACROYT_G031105 [Oculina patagonica]